MLGVSVSSARSATACTATRSAAGTAAAPLFGPLAEAGTVTAVSIASRIVSETESASPVMTSSCAHCMAQVTMDPSSVP
ncbi:MAG TPA: hypothetical protein VGY54_04245 [Polyangiaceae bacterium]|nr:hypothetical protein [Polyangiaceae bacterium]